MELQAIDGFGDVDATAVLKEKTLETLKRLPEGDVVALISQLPENVIRELCKKGINEELVGLLPSLIIGGISGGALYFIGGSMWWALFGGLASGLSYYFVEKIVTHP